MSEGEEEQGSRSNRENDRERRGSGLSITAFNAIFERRDANVCSRHVQERNGFSEVLQMKKKESILHYKFKDIARVTSHL